MAEVAAPRDMFAEMLFNFERRQLWLEAGDGGDKSTGEVCFDHGKQGYRRTEKSSRKGFSQKTLENAAGSWLARPKLLPCCSKLGFIRGMSDN